MPLVEIGRDMEEFQAWQVATTSTAYAPMGWDNVETNTTGSLLSIANASTGLVGTALQRCKVTMNLTQSSSGSNWFYLVRNQPSSTAPSGWAYGGADRVQSQAFLTASGGEAQSGSAVFILEPGDEISAISGAAGTAFYDSNYRSNFSILVEKDRSSSNMAHIIKPAVAIIKNVQAYNQGGGNALAGTWGSIPLNTVIGESWFLTFNSTNYETTLEPGTYVYTASAPFYDTNNTQLMLYNDTDSVVLTPGIPTYTTAYEGVGFNTLRLEHTFTVTKSTVIILKYRVQTEQLTNGLGYPPGIDSGVDAVYGLVKIEKLK